MMPCRHVESQRDYVEVCIQSDGIASTTHSNKMQNLQIALAGIARIAPSMRRLAKPTDGELVWVLLAFDSGNLQHASSTVALLHSVCASVVCLLHVRYNQIRCRTTPVAFLSSSSILPCPRLPVREHAALLSRYVQMKPPAR